MVASRDEVTLIDLSKNSTTRYRYADRSSRSLADHRRRETPRHQDVSCGEPGAL